MKMEPVDWIRAGIAYLLIIAVMLFGIVHACQGQEAVVRYGRMTPEVEKILDHDWDTQHPNQNERAYCVTQYSVRRAVVAKGEVDSIYTIEKIEPAHMRGADDMSSDYSCKVGQPDVHTHPPTTCMNEDHGHRKCWFGDVDAYQCQPSRNDLKIYLTEPTKALFRAVQCDRHALRYYYPSDIPPTMIVAQ